MSIFKESFKPWVSKQIKLREAIISQGNNMSGKNRGRDYLSKLSREEANKLGLPGPIDVGSFFTYTTSKQCIIRMCSGVNVRNDSTLFGNSKYERLLDLVGPGLAIRYVLEGGIPIKSTDFVKYDKDKKGNIQYNKDGSIKTVARDYEKATSQWSTRGLGKVKKGAFGNHYSATYGDPYIRSDSGDGYGIVPMPGILDCDVRTKTAYGSLREARVNFVVHNKRQLEIMELLYMRPGFPILIEWGWSQYINNDGKRESWFPNIPEFWEEDSSMQRINAKIMKNKVLTSGNYDGFLGMCKNFSFKAREDGGFDCETFIIGQGEIIESLKGKRSGRMKTIKEGDEEEIVEVDDFEYWLYALNLWCNTQSKRKGAANAIPTESEAIELYGALLEFVEQQFGLKSKTKGGELNYDYEEYVNLVSQQIQKAGANKLLEASLIGLGTSLLTFNPAAGLAAAGYTLTLETVVTDTPELAEDYALLEKHLDDFLIFKGENFFAGNENAIAGSNYVRWDFLIQILNKFVIDKVGSTSAGSEGERIAELTHRDWPSNKPLLYTKYKFKNVKQQTFKVKNEDGLEIDARLDSIVDMCVDPNIALLPHQINKITNDDLLDFGEEEEELKREIGRIMISLPFLSKTYKKMRYNEEGLAPDFNMFKFLKKVWDSISDACAGTHKFIVQTENERPNVLRVIDLAFANGDVDLMRLHTLKVQSNETIVRDFYFNSSIPNAMSSTIAIAAQNPDSISDLEATSFAALHTNIQTRFFQEPHVVSDATKESKAARYDTDLEKFFQNLNNLYNYRIGLLKGFFQEEDSEEEEEGKTNVISKNKALSITKSLEGYIISLSSRYPQDGPAEGDNDPAYFKGFRRPLFHQSKSEIIPLKFHAMLDGISGINIGNVFKIDKTRLPEGYQNEDIAFICMGEKQKISAGQDWTTTITGQITLLDISSEGELDELPTLSFSKVKPRATGGSPTAGIVGEQSEVIPELLEISDGDPVYLKIGDMPTWVRSEFVAGESKFDTGEMIDNETRRGNWDNSIGAFPGGYDQESITRAIIERSKAVNEVQASLDGISDPNSLPTDDPALLNYHEAAKKVLKAEVAIATAVAQASGNDLYKMEKDKHQEYAAFGEPAVDYLTTAIYDDYNQPILHDEYTANINFYKALGAKVGDPIIEYRSNYKGMLLGIKVAQKEEVRFQGTEREYATLWYKIKFTKQAYQVLSACPWVIDGYVTPKYQYYDPPNEWIKKRQGYLLPDVKKNYKPSGNFKEAYPTWPSPPLEIDPDSEVTEKSDLFGLPIISTPATVTGIDFDGADKAPYWDEEGKATYKHADDEFIDDFQGWMEISVIDTMINKDPERHNKDRDTYQPPDQDIFQFDGTTPMRDLLKYYHQNPKIQQAIDATKVKGYSYWGWGGGDDREKYDPFYPWWISCAASNRKSNAYKVWEGKDWDGLVQKDGHVVAGGQKYIQREVADPNGTWSYLIGDKGPHHVIFKHRFLSNHKNFKHPDGDFFGNTIPANNLTIPTTTKYLDMTLYEVSMWEHICSMTRNNWTGKWFK